MTLIRRQLYGPAELWSLVALAARLRGALRMFSVTSAGPFIFHLRKQG